MASKPELIHVVGSVEFRGPERYALDISRHFSACGWKVTAFTRDAKAVDSMFRDAGIRLRHAPLGGMSDITSAFALARLIRCISQGKVIIVHVHRFRDAFTALLARKIVRRNEVKVVMTCHNVRKGRDSWLSRRILRNLDALIFVSKIACERYFSTWDRKSLPMPESHVHVLHNSVHALEQFAPEPVKGPFVAMFHGPLTPSKGLEYLIDALALLKPLKMRLRIVGSGDPDYVDTLRRRAQTRGVMDMIDWKKYTPSPLDLIRESHIGVLPVIREEGFGMANIEYMACGRAQVCTARGAQREYLSDGREAFIVPPADTQALADRLRELAESPQLRAHMGLQARATFEKHLSWPRFISCLKEIYSVPETQ